MKKAIVVCVVVFFLLLSYVRAQGAPFCDGQTIPDAEVSDSGPGDSGTGAPADAPRPIGIRPELQPTRNLFFAGILDESLVVMRMEGQITQAQYDRAHAALVNLQPLPADVADKLSQLPPDLFVNNQLIRWDSTLTAAQANNAFMNSQTILSNSFIAGQLDRALLALVVSGQLNIKDYALASTTLLLGGNFNINMLSFASGRVDPNAPPAFDAIPRGTPQELLQRLTDGGITLEQYHAGLLFSDLTAAQAASGAANLRAQLEMELREERITREQYNAGLLNIQQIEAQQHFAAQAAAAGAAASSPGASVSAPVPVGGAAQSAQAATAAASAAFPQFDVCDAQGCSPAPTPTGFVSITGNSDGSITVVNSDGTSQTISAPEAPAASEAPAAELPGGSDAAPAQEPVAVSEPLAAVNPDDVMGAPAVEAPAAELPGGSDAAPAQEPVAVSEPLAAVNPDDVTGAPASASEAPAPEPLTFDQGSGIVFEDPFTGEIFFVPDQFFESAPSVAASEPDVAAPDLTFDQGFSCCDWGLEWWG